MFIGRERELATLNKVYASDKFEFVVIYGRRRVGKTALISQFIDRHGGRNLFPVLSGGFGICVQALRKRTNHSCNRRIPLCRSLIEKPCFHHSAFDRPVQGLFQTNADPLRLVDVLYGRSCPRLQSAALRQTDSADENSSL